MSLDTRQNRACQDHARQALRPPTDALGCDRSPSSRPRALLCLVSLCFVLSHCGGQKGAAEDTERSMREVQLAASLREEGSLPGALQHIKLALELDPNNAKAHLLLGYIQFERQSLPVARKHVHKAISILDETPDRERSTAAEARNLMGLVLFHQHDARAAIRWFSMAAEDPFNVTPYFAYGNLGMAHAAAGNLDEALRALQKAVDIQPKFCLGFFRMGEIHVRMNAWAEADEALSEALLADPRCEQFFQEAWAARGTVRARLGRHEDAVADLERCVELGKQTEAGRKCKKLLDSTNR